jgi:hypothetical protein
MNKEDLELVLRVLQCGASLTYIDEIDERKKAIEAVKKALACYQILMEDQA